MTFGRCEAKDCRRRPTHDAPKVWCTYHWTKWIEAGYSRDVVLQDLADMSDAAWELSEVLEELAATVDPTLPIHKRVGRAIRRIRPSYPMAQIGCRRDKKSRERREKRSKRSPS